MKTQRYMSDLAGNFWHLYVINCNGQYVGYATTNDKKIAIAWIEEEERPDVCDLCQQRTDKLPKVSFWKRWS